LGKFNEENLDDKVEWSIAFGNITKINDNDSYEILDPDPGICLPTSGRKLLKNKPNNTLRSNAEPNRPTHALNTDTTSVGAFEEFGTVGNGAAIILVARKNAN